MRRRLLWLFALSAVFALAGCWRQELVRQWHFTHPPQPVYVVP